jgi:CubicO group peptidase (beta-lactamase class C family)
LIHDEIGEILKRGVVARGAAPGASACVAAFREGAWRFAVGTSGTYSHADGTPVLPETLYDLASLTKPVVACTLARLVRSGALAWRAPLAELLPGLRGTESADTPLELLVAHRAGLEAHLRLDETPGGVAHWLERCANARRSECRTPVPSEGFPPLYSDLGYILAGAAITALLGEPLAAVVEREVSAPLCVELGSAQDYRRRLGEAAFLRRVAPTEILPARGGWLRGVVHDDNAWGHTGLGLSGHAGAFGTALGVARFGAAALDALAGRREAWLSAAELQVLVRPRPLGSLRAGFDGKAATGSAAGPRFGPRTFGHLGFTGTSLWCDPDAGVIAVLCTNRVCPSRENILIRDVRPGVHGELFGLAAGLESRESEG